MEHEGRWLKSGEKDSLSWFAWDSRSAPGVHDRKFKQCANKEIIVMCKMAEKGMMQF